MKPEFSHLRFRSEQIPHPDLREVRVFPTRDELVQAAATRLLLVPILNPSAHIGFATGATMEPVLSFASSLLSQVPVDFSRVRASHLDERYPMGSDHELSFARYVRERAVEPLGIQPENVRYWNGSAQNPTQEAEAYEKWLRAYPVDFQLLGIGPAGRVEAKKGGHIGFVESGFSFDTTCMYVPRLAEETLYRDRVERGEHVPDGALTQGIATIHRAKTILLLAFGASKGMPLYHALYGSVSPDCPASSLRTKGVGQKVSVFMDAEAYAALESARKNAIT